ncbi:pmpB, partial [Symbiodinium pilosum]
DLANEIGMSVMDSAFARVLQSGVNGVVMVLDDRIEPLTRVWCLFEFLLVSRLRCDPVFVTDLGVLGDEGTSPEVALAVGRKLETLQVAHCHASREEDKQKIFEYIRAEVGSLEDMDSQIKQRMGSILRQTLQNLENLQSATQNLMLQMVWGEGSFEQV